MPKLSCQSSRRPLDRETDQGLIVLAFEGFIDAANYLSFERALEKAAELNARFLVVDFARVHYVNSTGISALIRHHELYRARRGLLCLAGVPRTVGLTMHVLGLTRLVPFVKDVAAAEVHVRDFLAGRVKEPDGLAPGDAAEAVERRRKVFLREVASPRRRKDRKVLVIAPAENRFTRVLRRRFGYLNGGYHLLHDVNEALRRYLEIEPDLVVVDDRCDPRGEFVSRLKVQKERSLTSVIKLYGKTTDVHGQVEFKIWENDFLIDPFEVLEFFSLTEAELDRVTKDRQVFHQQVHFELRTRRENVEKAYRLSHLIIKSSFPEEEDVTTLYAAVKEGIDNAAVHGNHWDEDKTIDINFLVDQKKLTVIVEDQGEGFDYEYYLARVSGKEAFEEARKRILDEGIRGGLGILLMSRCTDRLEYSGSGNVLRLEKNR